MSKLSVIANQRKMGTVEQKQNRLTFRYDAAWLDSAQSYPLSMSMPMVRDEHPHEIIEPYLWGLLPDNRTVMDQWSKRFHVSPNNVFRLLEHVGEDCAGAIQFIPEEKESAILDKTYKEQVKWIDESELSLRIEQLLQDVASTRASTDEGQFSLAGAQPKTALYQCPQSGRWGVPFGQTPTTHILKPASSDFQGYAENEHFCLTLCSELGLRTASSTVIQCGAIPVISVKRYDRLFRNDRCIRIHQEDFCQARGIQPSLKYQNEGGPSIKDIADTIWDSSSDARSDIMRFARALIINFIIFGTDAHAKNYSLLIAANNQVLLAPLYDVSSALPYPSQVSPHKAKMAMKIGSKYRIKEIQSSHWVACAKDLRLKTSALIDMFDTLIARLPEACEMTREKLHAQGIHHPVIDLLADKINERTNLILRSLQNGLLRWPSLV